MMPILYWLRARTHPSSENLSSVSGWVVALALAAAVSMALLGCDDDPVEPGSDPPVEGEPLAAPTVRGYAANGMFIEWEPPADLDQHAVEVRGGGLGSDTWVSPRLEPLHSNGDAVRKYLHEGLSPGTIYTYRIVESGTDAPRVSPEVSVVAADVIAPAPPALVQTSIEGGRYELRVTGVTDSLSGEHVSDWELFYAFSLQYSGNGRWWVPSSAPVLTGPAAGPVQVGPDHDLLVNLETMDPGTRFSPVLIGLQVIDDAGNRSSLSWSTSSSPFVLHDASREHSEFHSPFANADDDGWFLNLMSDRIAYRFSGDSLQVFDRAISGPFEMAGTVDQLTAFQWALVSEGPSTSASDYRILDAASDPLVVLERSIDGTIVDRHARISEIIGGASYRLMHHTCIGWQGVEEIVVACSPCNSIKWVDPASGATIEEGPFNASMPKALCQGDVGAVLLREPACAVEFVRLRRGADVEVELDFALAGLLPVELAFDDQSVGVFGRRTHGSTEQVGMFVSDWNTPTYEDGQPRLVRFYHVPGVPHSYLNQNLCERNSGRISVSVEGSSVAVYVFDSEIGSGTLHVFR